MLGEMRRCDSGAGEDVREGRRGRRKRGSGSISRHGSSVEDPLSSLTFIGGIYKIQTSVKKRMRGRVGREREGGSEGE